MVAYAIFPLFYWKREVVMSREPDCPCSQPAQPRPRCRTLDALDASASAAPPAERGWSKDSFCPGVGSGLGVCKLKSLEQYVLYRYLLLRLPNVHFSGFLNVCLVYLFEVFICISFVFWMSSWLYSFIFSSFTHGSYFDKWWCRWSYVNSVPQNRGFCICAVSR